MFLMRAVVHAAIAIIIIVTALLAFSAFPPYHAGTRVISLAFDDGVASQYELAFPAMRERGLAGTLYVIANGSGSFEAERLMTLQQAAEMQSAGWEIGSHGLTHANLTAVSLGEAEDELRLSKETLGSAGFSVSSFAFPYSSYSSEVLDITKRYYRSSRPSLWGYNNLSSYDPYLLKSMWVENTTSADDACSWISSIPDGGWLILTFHNIGNTASSRYGISENTFGMILDCVASSGAAVRTISGIVGTA
jgi:peptidoglycan/xylan/chitin deacetylase (PgdA/CDA1 family)